MQLLRFYIKLIFPDIPEGTSAASTDTCMYRKHSSEWYRTNQKRRSYSQSSPCDRKQEVDYPQLDNISSRRRRRRTGSLGGVLVFHCFFFLLFPLQLIGWAETLSLDSAHHLPQRSCFQLQSLMREKSDWIVSHCGWQMFHPITLFPPHWSLPPPSSSSFSSSKRVRGNKWICETFTKFSQSFKTLRPSQFAAVSLTAAAAAPFVYRGEVGVEKKEWRLLLHH